MKRIKYYITIIVLLILNQTIKAHDFKVDGIYYKIISSIDKTVSVSYRGASSSSFSDEYSGNVTIPEKVTYMDITYSVTGIGDYAFYDCNSLNSIIIPSSVTSIGDRAFHGCNLLETIQIPSSVTIIGGEAFEFTPWYDKLPNGVIYINKVLYEYKGIVPANTYLKVQDGTVSISAGAFSEGLDYDIYLIETPGKYDGLISVELPNSVTYIGSSAFRGCRKLSSINIPNAVTYIGSYAFDRCDDLSVITIPNIPNIERKTFFSSGLEGEIVIPNSVTNIRSHAFQDCEKITSVIIPNSVTWIEERAFAHCKNLSKIVIGCGLQYMDDAFIGCVNISEIYVHSATPPIAYDYTFDEYVYKDAILYVPAGSESLYRETIWGKFRIINSMPATNIDKILKEKGDENVPIYNMQGVKMQNVSNLKKGIYIKNGKKFCVK